jgi:hypothetical protein
LYGFESIIQEPRIIGKKIQIVCCSTGLREAQNVSDEVKKLYLVVCRSTEKFLATLECEQKVKKEVATLLDVGTEKLKKEQAVLETERQKVSVAVAVPDIETTTHYVMTH